MHKPSGAHWFRRYDWDAIAGIAAAVAALILHLFHVVQIDILLTITLVLVALLLLRQLRHEEREERVEATTGRTEQMIAKLQDGLKAPDVVLVGPRHLREASEAFARHARGDMVWFNVCLTMFRPQELFDCLLRPAVENPLVTQIAFVLDEGEQTNWRDHVAPKLAACRGRDKVREPRWCNLKETVSFILADRESDGQVEAQLSFWGEPFMARATGRDVPRYIFHVQAHSELIPQLVELERRYRMLR
ncbi:MAG: hypothetical protein A3H97_10250 [Acidobacteria bacterium RIFCSPLOWO2_02_FULL_65_29]|nr:MAG: hypothetical protein A3H97_10250 [Acidobacteria bacterium RIFCSPLOWO2_02_FULL_65_29]